MKSEYQESTLRPATELGFMVGIFELKILGIIMAFVCVIKSF